MAEILVLLESTEKVYDGDSFGVNMETPSEDVVKFIAPAVLEDTGINIETLNFTTRKITEKNQIFVYAKATAG